MTLTLDPSLTAFGWAVVDDLTIIDYGCIITKKDNKIRVTSDRIRRLSLIVNTLQEVMQKYPIDIVYFEIPSGSKSNTAAIALGMIHGLVVTFCICNNVAFTPCLAKSAKKTTTGDSDGTKEAVFINVLNSFKNARKLFDTKMTKEKRFAVSDALAIYLTIKKQ